MGERETRKSDVDSQLQVASFVGERFIAPSDHARHAKQLSKAELQVGLAFTAFILIGANDGAFGVLIPSLRTHYGVDKATIGLLFLVQTVGYLIAAFNGLKLCGVESRGFGQGEETPPLCIRRPF